MQRRTFLRSTGVASLFGLAGCTQLNQSGQPTQSNQNKTTGPAQVGDRELVLATTTSTYDTGSLDHLHPTFEEAFGITMKTLSKGTGASLQTARDGDADVILVHARNAEDKFMQDGFGVNRRDVMFNDFVVAYIGFLTSPQGQSMIEE